jgi:5-methylthioadenosine/S-adenosylhomocysteine deaminase
MATSRRAIDPANSPKLALAGRVVTMDGAFRVVDSGCIYMENGSIVAVRETGAPAPAGFEGVPVRDTASTLYPGLIDLHNHMPYNVLPLWQVPRKFGNRGQWGRHAEYRQKVSAPMQTLAATEELLASICRYVEVKALVGGTTTSQGITLANEAGIRRYFKGVVRNVESTDDDDLPEVSTRVPDVAARDAQAFFTRLKREQTCYLLHLSEGTDATARRAFQALEFEPGQWAITPSLCGIHAAALQAPDFHALAEKGGSMVWSPFSNLLLYGGTADVGAAKAAGVPIALGADWSPTGSRNLLGELKVAHVLGTEDGVHSARELVAMVTREAARMLEWFGALGSLEAGKRADIVAIAGTSQDPYLQLIRAKESDISLVLINGVGRFGSVSHMRAVGPSGERMSLAGQPRLLYLPHPSADPLSAGLTFAAARDALKSALRRLPSLARRAERPQRISAAARAANAGNVWRLALDEIVDSGVDLRPRLAPRDAQGRPMRLPAMRPPMTALLRPSAVVSPMSIDALTVVEDDMYLDAIDAQPNLPEVVKRGLRALWS